MAVRSSVLIASFNYARFLEDSVRSVWAQSCHDIELVVVDDGSTDGSLELARSLVAHSPIPMRVLGHSNCGVVRTFNRGLAESSGTYVQLLAADDRFHPDKTQLQMRALDEMPEAVLCHSLYRPIDEAGQPLDEKGASRWESTQFQPAQGQSFEDLLLGRTMVRTGLMIRRSALEQWGGFDESYRAEDLPVILRAARVGPIAFVPQPLVERRLHGRNWTFRFLRQTTGELSTREAGLELFERLAPRDLAVEAAWRTTRACVTAGTNAGNGRWAWQFAVAAVRSYPELRRRLPLLAANTALSLVWNQGFRRVLPPALTRRLAQQIRQILPRSTT